MVLVFNSSIEEEIMEALKEGGMSCYTKITDVQGVGKESEPRLDSHVWPGTNTMLLVCTDAERRPGLVEAIRSVRAKHKEEGVRGFILPVTDFI
jgi:hypothetical protein